MIVCIMHLVAGFIICGAEFSFVIFLQASPLGS